MLHTSHLYVVVPTEKDWDENYNAKTNMLSWVQMYNNEKPSTFPAYFHISHPAGYDSAAFIGKLNRDEFLFWVLWDLSSADSYLNDEELTELIQDIIAISKLGQ